MAARRRLRLSSRLFWIAAIGAAVAGHAAAGPADTAAAATTEKLKQVEGALTRARRDHDNVRSLKATLAQEVTAVRAALRIAAAEARDHQRGLQAAERRLAELGRSAARARALLAVRRRALAAVSGTLQTLVRRPPEAFVSGAYSALDMARTSALLDGAATRIAAAAADLREQLATVAQTTASIRVERANLAVAVAAFERQRGKLDGLLAEKARLLASVNAADATWRARMEALAGSARDLRGLLEQLSLHRRAEGRAADRLAALAVPIPPPGTRPPGASPPTAPGGLFTQSILARKGQLPAPVIGRVVHGFGRRDGRGQITKGVAIRSRAGAPVVAPFDGRVLYAGPFRSYGLILIIDHGQGYHTLLAGLGRLHMAVGQTVLAGEPIGVMARDKELSADRLDLYLELRHDGTPIDPLPWLALETGIASG
ncbi:MAG: hypothetical protein CMH68_00270 [Nisaea sp.]|nr:hypothetical protein [Nisaea sp.]